MTPEQAAMMQAWQDAMTPGEPHERLASMVGDFDVEVKSWMEPGGDPMVSPATAHREMRMGGRILYEEVEGEFMGQPFHGVGHVGYDNVMDRYWSTWMDNMSTGVMTSTGTWDAASGTATYWGQSADPMSGKMMKVKTVIKPGEDKEVMEMYMTPEGGQEMKSMEIVYTRQ
jgi:hypothetical protein